MAELRESHLRYLLAIYELGRAQPDVGTLNIANALGYTKASVTKMAGTLMDMGLLVREKYGKIYLTDTGFLLAKDMPRCVEVLQERFPALGLELTAEETHDLIYTMVTPGLRPPNPSTLPTTGTPARAATWQPRTPLTARIQDGSRASA